MQHLRFLLYIIISASSFCYSQNLDWAFTVGTPNQECVGRTVIVDSANYIYTTGNFGNTADFDPGDNVFELSNFSESSLLTDAFVAKYTPSGNLVWAFNLGADRGEGIALHLDQQNNLLVLGAFEGSPDFDPGPETVTVTSQSEQFTRDLFLAKYDTSGNYLWSFTLPAGVTIRGNAASLGLGTDSENNVYISGKTQDTIDLDPGPDTLLIEGARFAPQAFVAKYSSQGDFIWGRHLASSQFSTANDLVIGQMGLYVTGDFNGALLFDPEYENDTVTNNSIFLAKYQLSGQLEWVKPFRSDSFSFPSPTAVSIAIGDDDNLFIGGIHNEGLDFDPGSDTVRLGITNGFLAKYTSEGNLAWAHSIGGNTDPSTFSLNEVLDVQIGREGQVAVIGTHSDTIDFDPGPGTAIFKAEGFHDIFAVSYANTGEYQWAFTIDNRGSAHGEGLAFDNDDNLLVTGRYLDTADFDPSLDTFNLISTEWGWDFFLAKYRLGFPTSTTPFFPENRISIYPNPAEDYLNIAQTTNHQSLHYEVIDVNGHRLIRSNEQQRINITSLPPGIYFLRTYELGRWHVQKFVKR